MDVKNRLMNYYRNNVFIQKYVFGMNVETNEIILSYNGLKKNISIDDLENITREEQIISFLNGNVPQVNMQNDSLAEPKVISDELDRETLNDIKILTEIKSKTGLDNLLKDFAVNESTGLIDINKAINIVEQNTIDELINSIKEHHDFDLNLENYDKTGKHVGNILTTDRSEEEKIMSSFNNIKVYLDAANMYPEQASFSEEDINNRLAMYIEKVKGLLHPNEAQKKDTQKTKKLENNNQNDAKSAGFADILVLSIIVLVYAIIIVNLILKLV